MGPGTIQIGFAFHDGAPLCTRCGVRSAKADPRIPGTFFLLCARCIRQGRKDRSNAVGRARRISPCAWCRKPHDRWPNPRRRVTCSPLCNQQLSAKRGAEDKAEVLRLLGGRCTCAACGWHGGPCTVTDPALLEVDHTKGNGSTIRTTTRDGTRKRGLSSTEKWHLYLREILTHPTSHGLQLLCANCHRWITHARRG